MDSTLLSKSSSRYGAEGISLPPVRMIIGTQILDRKLPSVAEGLACDRLFLVLEERVAELHPDLLPQLQSALPEAICRTLRGGEECKTTDLAQRRGGYSP